MTFSEPSVTVSVIVLTYNHSDYIRQALDSILMQKTDFNYEILVGDDASSDGTQEILKEYKERFPDKFRLTLRKENIGASSNAYDLMTSAKGKYLATCEGDDFWTSPHKLQLQVDFLEKNPEFIGCVHKCTVVDENGNRIAGSGIEWVKEREVFTLKDYQGLYLPGQLATYVRKNIFLNPEHDYSIIYKAHRMVADRVSFLIYLSMGNVYTFSETMSAYRKVAKKGAANVTSISFASNPRRVIEEYDMLLALEKYSAEELKLDISFEKRKKELFGDAILHFLCKPDKMNREAVLKIFNLSESRIRYIIYLPISVTKRIIKFVRHRLER